MQIVFYTNSTKWQKIIKLMKKHQYIAIDINLETTNLEKLINYISFDMQDSTMICNIEGPFSNDNYTYISEQLLKLKSKVKNLIIRTKSDFFTAIIRQEIGMQYNKENNPDIDLDKHGINFAWHTYDADEKSYYLCKYIPTDDDMLGTPIVDLTSKNIDLSVFSKLNKGKSYVLIY